MTVLISPSPNLGDYKFRIYPRLWTQFSHLLAGYRKSTLDFMRGHMVPYQNQQGKLGYI